MTIELIRHGSTALQSAGKYQGRKSDPPLSEDGKRALQKASSSPAFVYVSSMLRARETASILFPDAVLLEVPDLEEMDFGIFEGLSYTELSENADYLAWLDSGCLAKIPEGESKELFCRRVCDSFRILMDCVKNIDHMVIVAHGGTLMALMERYAQPARSYFDWHPECGKGFLLSADHWAQTQSLQFLKITDYTRTSL